MKRLIISLAMLAAVQASAQNIKPGLWELTNKVKTGNAQTDQAMNALFKQLANMPPEQRAQMEALMKQNGASLPQAGGDGAIIIKACVTPEMAAKKEMPVNQQGKCSSKSDPVAGGMNISFSCTDPVSSGTGALRFNGDSNYVMNMNVTSEAGGKPQNVQVESTGRWLGATCPARSN
ncbi:MULTISPECIES: DUF3617 domain-containing protein [unclassified Duganella]|uniref:DUF3617 domain-containing protein n=1 Tax=unclassified Duganella TaxID=2636909 RepID=UPI000E34CEA5|nr:MULTISPECIES: DUF3617 domain-containing protein [unclassified Duganella]RFP15856.1 DUF3617 domain-containing protein [Duganella sp. BJB475]RFP32980.1 DUF3617 domain-containing protein [Duganella sp. BJB476]